MSSDVIICELQAEFCAVIAYTRCYTLRETKKIVYFYSFFTFYTQNWLITKMQKKKLSEFIIQRRFQMIIDFGVCIEIDSILIEINCDFSSFFMSNSSQIFAQFRQFYIQFNFSRERRESDIDADCGPNKFTNKYHSKNWQWSQKNTRWD